MPHELAGTWQLESWTARDQHGNVEKPFGEQPTGLLVITTDGWMSVQLAASDRPHFPVRRSGTAPRMAWPTTVFARIVRHVDRRRLPLTGLRLVGERPGLTAAPARPAPGGALPMLASGEHVRRVLEGQAVRLGHGSGHQVAGERGQPLCEDRIGGGGADHAVSGDAQQVGQGGGGQCEG